MSVDKEMPEKLDPAKTGTYSSELFTTIASVVDRLVDPNRFEQKFSKTLILLAIFIIGWYALSTGEAENTFLSGFLKSIFGFVAVGLILVATLVRIWLRDIQLDDVSFVALDERTRKEKSRYSSNSKGERLVGQDLEARVKKTTSIAVGVDFVAHMRAVIESLDYQIDYAEQKASIMLDIGRRFIKWGIWSYVFAIFGWQAYLFYLDFKVTAALIAGMVSCSLLFIIVEFLGAWYLKQYRHYGDSAYSYMRARSSYHKYMLGYCAVIEFMGEDLDGAKEDVLKVLAEPEKWPEFKDVSSNDFNYMLQSVESAGVLFDKMKGVFGHGKKDGSPQ